MISVRLLNAVAVLDLIRLQQRRKYIGGLRNHLPIQNNDRTYPRLRCMLRLWIVRPKSLRESQGEIFPVIFGFIALGLHAHSVPKRRSEMILTSKEISDLKLVENPASGATRESTYDATVGEIFQEGKRFQGSEYDLPPRGMVWVVSNERFNLPSNVTGLATLRTTWTHDGILTLNVGIVDPGWNGPLAAAVVNFSSSNFEVRKGETFLRVLFIDHKATDASKVLKETKAYENYIKGKSARTPSTFLNIKALATEILGEIYGTSGFSGKLSRIALTIALLGTLLARIMQPMLADVV